jgi:O-antigen/teichoic acid export membrane protein
LFYFLALRPVGSIFIGVQSTFNSFYSEQNTLKKLIQIGQKDIFWNYAATLLKIASSALLLPFILRIMPSETVGIWSIFMILSTFATLLDFGFSPSFARNVTYVFSGVRTLKVNGFESVTLENQTVDYGLLKGVISSMKWIYLRMSIILFLLFATIGTYYISSLLKNYKGNPSEVYIAWVILCLINTYNLFTLYYDSLLQGKGLVKKSKQIVIIGQSVYIVFAAILILEGYGLVAIISAQASSVIIIRWLSYHAFFTLDIKQKLADATARPQKEILKAIYPNAFKIGLTSLGGFMVQKSAIVIGSLYMTLEEIASYGISMQLITIIAGLSGIYIATFQPKIAQLRVENNGSAIKELYLKGQFIMILIFIIGGMTLIFLGQPALKYIGSQTRLMPFLFLLLAVLVLLIETNLSIAGNILLTKNEVPFYKAALVSGSCIVLSLFLVFNYTDLGLLSLILVPLIIDLAYQAWKWPWEVIKELKITVKDYHEALYSLLTIRR